MRFAQGRRSRGRLGWQIGLVLGVALLPAACVKKFPIALPSLDYRAYGLKGIFRDDFPFFISAQTPDPGTAIPPTRWGCGVKVLPEGREDFAVRELVMQSAEHYLYLQNYIFANDSTGRATAGIMAEKVKAGVGVYVVVDAYGKLSNFHRTLYAEMRDQGIQMAGFEPKAMTFLSPNYVPTMRELNMRYHEKYLIVDDTYGVVGGANIADSYAGVGAAPGIELRDQDVLLTGPIVADLRRAFEENFNDLKWLEQSRPAVFHDRKKFANGFKVRPGSASARLLPIEFTDENVPVRLLRSRPRYEESYIYQGYLYLIRTAQKSILLENSYYIPDRELNDALLSAARRGVEVTLIVDVGKARDKLQMQPIMIRHYYLPLVEAGIKVYEWQSTLRGEGELHGKLSVFDGEVAVVGSYNFDPRCQYLNSENVAVIDSQKVSRALTDYVLAHDLARSELISREKAEANRYPREPTRFIRLSWALMVKDYW